MDAEGLKSYLVALDANNSAGRAGAILPTGQKEAGKKKRKASGAASAPLGPKQRGKRKKGEGTGGNGAKGYVDPNGNNAISNANQMLSDELTSQGVAIEGKKMLCVARCRVLCAHFLARNCKYNTQHRHTCLSSLTLNAIPCTCTLTKRAPRFSLPINSSRDCQANCSTTE